MLLLFALILASSGAALICRGWNDIQQRHAEFSWSRSRSGPYKTIVFQGSAAVRQGAGFIAFGGMLGICSAVVLVSIIRRLAGKSADEKPATAYPWGWLTLACLLTAFGCLLPPRELAGQCALTVVLLIGFALFSPRGSILNAHSAKVFPILIFAAIISAFCGADEASTGIALGIFIGLAIGAHAFLLLPSLRLTLKNPDGE